MQFGETRVSKKKYPIFQILRICALIANLCFWSQRCRQRREWPLLLYHPQLLHAPLLPAEVISSEFKVLIPFFPLYNFSAATFHGSILLCVNQKVLLRRILIVTNFLSSYFSCHQFFFNLAHLFSNPDFGFSYIFVFINLNCWEISSSLLCN